MAVGNGLQAKGKPTLGSDEDDDDDDDDDEESVSNENSFLKLRRECFEIILNFV